MGNPLDNGGRVEGNGCKQNRLTPGEGNPISRGVEVGPGGNGKGDGGGKAIELISRSSAYRTFVPAYRKVTGLSLILLPSDGHWNGHGQEVEFCRWLWRMPAGKAACERFAQQVHVRAVAERQLHCSRCFAGLVEIAVPIFNGEEHVATLLTGRVFRERPGGEDWRRACGVLGQCAQAELERGRLAYEAVPVIHNHQLQAACNLLKFFAQTVEENFPAWLLSHERQVPPGVAKAEEYIAHHLVDGQVPLHLPEVARHAGIGVQHFCRVFKRSVGLTFTQFVARSRTERAKSLLHNPSCRIGEVALDCGFGSIPTFNRTFKRLVGVSPRAYRERVEAKF